MTICDNACVWEYSCHGVHVEFRGALCGVQSPFSPFCGFWGRTRVITLWRNIYTHWASFQPLLLLLNKSEGLFKSNAPLGLYVHRHLDNWAQRMTTNKKQAAHQDYLSPYDAMFPLSNLWRRQSPDGLSRWLRSRKPCSAKILYEYSLLLNPFTRLLIHSSAAPGTLSFFPPVPEPCHHQHLGSTHSRDPVWGSNMWSSWLTAWWLPPRLQVSINMVFLPRFLIPQPVNWHPVQAWILFQSE